MKANPLRYEDLASLAGVSGQGWEFYGAPVASEGRATSSSSHAPKRKFDWLGLSAKVQEKSKFGFFLIRLNFDSCWAS
jgi:hypothetical protein